MTHIEHTTHHFSVHTTTAADLVSKLLNLTRNGLSHSVQRQEDDAAFLAGRLKSSRLPPVQSCQSSIFRELRQREESNPHPRPEHANSASHAPCLFGIRQRLGQLFVVPRELLH